MRKRFTAHFCQYESKFSKKTLSLWSAVGSHYFVGNKHVRKENNWS